MISLSGYWFLFLFFFSFFLSFLIKTCSVVNLIEHLPHKIHRNNFLLKKRLTPYIISGGARSRQGLRAPGSPLRPLSLHLRSLIDPPISFIYGHVHRPIGKSFILWGELQRMKKKKKNFKKIFKYKHCGVLVQMHTQTFTAMPPAQKVRMSCSPGAGGSHWGTEERVWSCQFCFSKQQLLVLLLYWALNDKLFIFQSSGANMLHLLALPCAPSAAQTQEHIKSSWWSTNSGRTECV